VPPRSSPACLPTGRADHGKAVIVACSGGSEPVSHPKPPVAFAITRALGRNYSCIARFLSTPFPRCAFPGPVRSLMRQSWGFGTGPAFRARRGGPELRFPFRLQSCGRFRASCIRPISDQESAEHQLACEDDPSFSKRSRSMVTPFRYITNIRYITFNEPDTCKAQCGDCGRSRESLGKKGSYGAFGPTGLG